MLTKPGIGEAWDRLKRDVLYINAIYIFGNSIATSGAGFLFWAIASRLFRVEVIGISSSMLSLAQVLSFVGGLGLVNGLTRYLPGDEHPKRLANSVILLSVVSSAVVGSAFAIFNSLVPLPSMQAYRGIPIYVPMLVLLVSMAIFASTGGVFIATRKAVYALYQVVIMNALRLGLLVPLIYLEDWGVIGAILGGYLLASLIGWFVFVRQVLPGYRFAMRIYWSQIKPLISFAIGDYFGDILRQMPQSLSVPIALVLAGSKNSAYLYVVWMIATLTSGPSLALSRSALVEGIHFPSQSKRILMRAGGAALVITTLLAMALFASSEYVLSVFGAEYADNGTAILRLMLVASPMVALNLTLLAFLRVMKNVRGLVISSSILATLTLLSATYTMGWLGISSVGYGWIVANIVSLLYLLTVSRRLIHDH